MFVVRARQKGVRTIAARELVDCEYKEVVSRSISTVAYAESSERINTRIYRKKNYQIDD